MMVFQSAKRICAVSKSTDTFTILSSRFSFNPPSGFVLFRSALTLAGAPTGACFNPPSGFVLFRSNTLILGNFRQFVSIRQADLCCFEDRADNMAIDARECFNPPSGFVLFRRCSMARWGTFRRWVSIRQADLCCFEVSRTAWLSRTATSRFNPPSGFVLFRSFLPMIALPSDLVSIRQADLCCFEEHSE